MENIINIGMLIVGFVFLIKGADVFVDGASLIARKLGIPSVIVGLTIISLGTSAPELAVSTISALNGNNGIAIGNILGSNIFNTLVVLGGTSIAMPLIIKKKLIKKDFLFNICIIILLYILSFGVVLNWNNGILTRINGITLVVLCVLYTFFLVRSAIKGKIRESEGEKRELQKIKVGINILKIVIGVIGIVLGGELAVDGASGIATALGMSDNLVGLTIVAVGTSLPELITSIVAALKGETEIAIGNVLGSNIFNILLILGVSSTINPIEVSGNLRFDIIYLLIVTLIIGIMIFFNKREKIKKIGRTEGVLLILAYIVYLIFIILRN